VGWKKTENVNIIISVADNVSTNMTIFETKDVDYKVKVSVSAVSIDTNADSYLTGMGRYFFVQIPKDT